MSNDDNRGLYGKYNVTKVETGESADTVIFCLDRRDPNALAALLEYAKCTNNRELARDIWGMVERILTDPRLHLDVRWEKSDVDVMYLDHILSNGPDDGREDNS